jgi:hypothetical protein
MGIIGIFLGVENASDSGLKSLARGSSPEEIETALKLIKIHKLAGTFNLLMFHPRANLKEINENIIFMKKFDEFASDFGRAEIVAGSPLEMYVAKNNLLRGQWPQWDYRIMDDGVEKMFRLIMLTFYKPGSFYPQLSHQTIALAYHSQVLQRIHGGDIADRYQKKAHEIIKTINKYKIDNLLEIYRLTGKDDVFEEIDEVYQQMNQKFQLYLKVVNNLSQKMKKYQITNREFKDKGLEDYLQKSKLLKRFFY